VLGVAEALDASIDAALRAFVLGYEVECQLGPLFNPSQYEVGWHATATQGTFAATAAAGWLLGLDPARMAVALGIAGSLLGGVRHNFGTMTMSFHSGVAASSGIRAARLAAAGFTAAPDIFDGPLSIGHALSHEWSAARLESSLARWGRPFAIVDSGPIFKLLPTGRPTVAPIECALAVRERLGGQLADIARVVCDVSFMYARTLIHAAPTTGLQGKTSLQYCVAAALLHGTPTLDSFTDAAVARPEVRELMGRIEVRVPADQSEAVEAVRAQPFDQPVTVTVETTAGRQESHTVRHAKGTPKNPVGEADLLEKFAGCSRGRYAPGRGAEIMALLRRPDAKLRDLLRLVA
jgi:2-methylcitrate dehydratase PrpD